MSEGDNKAGSLSVGKTAEWIQQLPREWSDIARLRRTLLGKCC